MSACRSGEEKNVTGRVEARWPAGFAVLCRFYARRRGEYRELWRPRKPVGGGSPSSSETGIGIN